MENTQGGGPPVLLFLSILQYSIVPSFRPFCSLLRLRPHAVIIVWDVVHKKSRRLFRLRPVKIQILRQLPQADSSLKKPKKKQKSKQ
jgi:hypothetical protein